MSYYSFWCLISKYIFTADFSCKEFSCYCIESSGEIKKVPLRKWSHKECRYSIVALMIHLLGKVTVSAEWMWQLIHDNKMKSLTICMWEGAMLHLLIIRILYTYTQTYSVPMPSRSLPIVERYIPSIPS